MIHLFFHELHPPRARIDRDLDFVLRVAFGKGPVEYSPQVSGESAWRHANQVGLAAAVAERLQGQACVNQLGADVVREMGVACERATRNRQLCDAASERFQTALSGTGVDVVLLDAPLLVGPHEKSHLPRCSDAFALVDTNDMQSITLALVRAGFDSGVRESAHGLESVFTLPEGGAVLLKRQLRFVRMVPGGVFVDVACLKRCGQLWPKVVADGRGTWQLSPSLRAAHQAAQALVEFRFAGECSALAALLSAVELGLASDEDLAFDAFLLLQTDVDHAEFQAWRELGRALSSGDLSSLSNRARTLLDHAIAAGTTPLYQMKLRAQRRAQQWQHDGHAERMAERLGELAARAKRFRWPKG